MTRLEEIKKRLRGIVPGLKNKVFHSWSHEDIAWLLKENEKKTKNLEKVQEELDLFYGKE